MLCISPGYVEQRYNPSEVTPMLLDSNNPSIGLSNQNTSLSNGWLTCSFTRLKSNNLVANYFDLNNQYYILAAYGSSTSARSLPYSGVITKHIVKAYSSEKFNFSSFSLVSSVTDNIKLKAHGKP